MIRPPAAKRILQYYASCAHVITAGVSRTEMTYSFGVSVGHDESHEPMDAVKSRTGKNQRHRGTIFYLVFLYINTRRAVVRRNRNRVYGTGICTSPNIILWSLMVGRPRRPLRVG